MRRDYRLDILGLFFLILGIVAVINTVYNEDPFKVLYLCYIGLIILGIGVLKRNIGLVLSQIYILLIPLLIWNVDFFYQLILGKPLFGITDYFFGNDFLTLGRVISLQHIITIPLGIYVASLIGFKKNKAELISLVEVLIMFLIVLLFTNPAVNINCVFFSCVDLSVPFYKSFYLLAFAVSIYVSKFVVEGFFKGIKKGPQRFF